MGGHLQTFANTIGVPILCITSSVLVVFGCYSKRHVPERISANAINAMSVEQDQNHKTLSSGERSPVKSRNSFIPDKTVRRLFASLRVEQVDRLCFSGQHMGADPQDPIVVKDRSLVQRFLTALQHATQNNGSSPGIRVDTLEVYLKPQLTRSTKPITLYFFPAYASECFGVDFQNALVDLGRLQAQRTRNLIHARGRDVKRIDLGVYAVKSISNPGEVETLLSALGQLNERAFAYTAVDPIEFVVTLHLRRGGSRDIFFLVDPDSRGITSTHARPPVPEPLWSFIRAEMKVQ